MTTMIKAMNSDAMAIKLAKETFIAVDMFSKAVHEEQHRAEITLFLYFY